MNRHALVLALVGGVTVTSAQTRAPAEVRFEVASIRPSAGVFSPTPNSPDRFYRSNVTVEALIRIAYDLPSFRIVGAPAWTRGERFDVSAKAAAAQPFPTTRLMLQRLLKDRFNLKARIEVRELPIYALVQSRPDEPPGGRLQRSTFDCAAFVAGGGTLEDAPKRPDGKLSLCLTTISVGASGETLTTGGVSMGQFARILEGFVLRTVVDDTGLTGTFDAALTFVTEADAAADTTTNGVSIFTALHEQLGLKLEPSRRPVEVLVIDSVERPTPD